MAPQTKPAAPQLAEVVEGDTETDELWRPQALIDERDAGGTWLCVTVLWDGRSVGRKQHKIGTLAMEDLENCEALIGAEWGSGDFVLLNTKPNHAWSVRRKITVLPVHGPAFDPDRPAVQVLPPEKAGSMQLGQAGSLEVMMMKMDMRFEQMQRQINEAPRGESAMDKMVALLMQSVLSDKSTQSEQLMAATSAAIKMGMDLHVDVNGHRDAEGAMTAGVKELGSAVRAFIEMKGGAQSIAAKVADAAKQLPEATTDEDEALGKLLHRSLVGGWTGTATVEQMVDQFGKPTVVGWAKNLEKALIAAGKAYEPFGTEYRTNEPRRTKWNKQFLDYFQANAAELQK